MFHKISHIDAVGTNHNRRKKCFKARGRTSICQTWYHKYFWHGGLAILLEALAKLGFGRIYLSWICGQCQWQIQRFCWMTWLVGRFKISMDFGKGTPLPHVVYYEDGGAALHVREGGWAWSALQDSTAWSDTTYDYLCGWHGHLHPSYMAWYSHLRSHSHRLWGIIWATDELQQVFDALG